MYAAFVCSCKISEGQCLEEIFSLNKFSACNLFSKSYTHKAIFWYSEHFLSD